MAVQRHHLARSSGQKENLHTQFAFIVPGSVSANTNIGLPAYAKGAAKIVQGILQRSNSITWSGLGATGATIATRDVAAAASGSDVVSEFIELTVVTTTPSGNQIQLYDRDNVRLGVDTIAGDGLILVLQYTS